MHLAQVAAAVVFDENRRDGRDAELDVAIHPAGFVNRHGQLWIFAPSGPAPGSRPRTSSSADGARTASRSRTTSSVWQTATHRTILRLYPPARICAMAGRGNRRVIESTNDHRCKWRIVSIRLKPDTTCHSSLVLVVSGFSRIGAAGFRAGVDLTTLAVTVTDRKGNIVTDLRARISRSSRTASRRPSSTSRAATGDTSPAMHLGLMLDASGSMQADMKLAQGAAIKFLNMLPAAEDITLVDFDTQVRITRYPQRDFARLVERIRQRKPDGWTALYDALGTYLDGAGPAGRPQGDGDVHRRRRHAFGAELLARRSTCSRHRRSRSTPSAWSRTPARRARSCR